MFVKLTEADGRTNGNIQWGPGIRHEARKKKGRLTPEDLCSPYVIHYYSSRYLATLLNPIHANFKRPLAWEFIPEGETCTDGLKHGSQAGTTTKRIRLPRYSIEQRVAFGIFCAKTTCENAAWNNQADAWLSGEDRTAWSARAAAEAARAARAAAEAARAAAWTAATATEAAAWAVAWTAAEAAWAVAWEAAEAARAAAWAAMAATDAAAERGAAAAAEAVAAATEVAEPLNLDALALKAYKWRDPLQGERKGE